tara:strand:+ start:35702 stop:36007 length:306 start_codon:yes stop_codon:yes gene_type:complete
MGLLSTEDGSFFFVIDFSLNGAPWEVACSISQEVRRYEGMAYRAVDTFYIESATSGDQVLDGEEWKLLLSENKEEKTSFWRAVTSHLLMMANAHAMEHYEA